MSVKLDHIYLSVKNMDRAVLFWEDLLETKVKHRENNTWADFDNGSSWYFGLINPDIVSEKRIIGNNAIPVFYTDDVDSVYEKVKKYSCKIISEPENLEFTDYFYRCFYFEDTEGNLIEIAKYERE